MTTVSNGQTSTGLSVSSGETLIVASGGVISATQVASGGVVTISSGGAESGTIISAGGSETVSSGGSAHGDTIFGAMVIISTGANGVGDETIGSGGELFVSKSATVSNTILSGGGTVDLITQAGTLAGALTFAGGGNTLLVGAVPSTVGSTGDLAAISGFIATDRIDITAVAAAGAALSVTASGGNTVAEVMSGGKIVDAFIFSGTATYTGATLSLTSDANGHAEIVFVSGGVSSSGGGSSPGVTSVTTSTVSGAYTETSGNTLLVEAGGSVSAATIASGGVLTVNSGGAAFSTAILAGGSATVLGSATGDQVHGVELVSAGGAVVSGDTVYAGGELDLFLKGVVAIGATVLSGGALNINGNAIASNTTLSGGGVLDLQSPKANVTGSLTFAGGGNTVEITDTTSTGFGVSATLSGFSAADRIALTSAAFVGADLSLSQTVSGANTVVQVISGGSTVVETFVFAGTALDGGFGLLADGAGGVDLQVLPVSVTTSVTTSTASGAYEESATNTLLVLQGGSVAGAIIDGGAFLTIRGGADSGAAILAGGIETVSAGSASGDQIFGSAVIEGGSVSDEIVQSGGVLQVGAGASVGNVTLNSGGVLELSSPTAAAAGTLTFAGGGGVLKADAIAAAGRGDLAVISGFSSADKIDIAGIGPSGATVSFASNGDGQEIVTVSGGGGQESFLFSDPATYHSGAMSLISDGAGGVDLILDTTPVVAMTSLGGRTNAATTIVNGTVDVAVDPEAVGTTVSVLEGDTVVGVGVVGANGRWSAKVTFADGDGTNVLTARDTDAAGNTGTTAQPLAYDVDTAAAAFLPGDLVVSISGDGDGSGSYGDNQASPLTLEEITRAGAYVGQIVLPQTTTVVNGVTEYAVSAEYGSSSEGALELSADGHSLVIAGYGINAAIFNAGGAAVYGDAALAQSTSVPGGAYTAVARLIADINADGVIDSSTALYNVFNTNNPRSVATVNGSSFWITGQGVKGDATQGVFYALDGASSATVINDATDARTAAIYNGQLYVSTDSTQGAANIADYGALPTSATTPVVLQGLSTSVVLTSATANGVNAADIGSSVKLSPEAFFFANADTLYVADGGNPKAGGLGDGGLQKWVYDGARWNLEYTLSAGLDLVADTAASGTTGLIGLTGKVVGDSVELFATNSTLTDLGQTYVYEITDSLGATSGAGESFTAIMAAAPGENIRGIAFAPTAYAPSALTPTNYLGQGVSDVLIQDAGGALAVGQAGAGGQFDFQTVGGLGSDWTIKESGDFLGDGKSQFLMQDANGAVAVGEVGPSGAAAYAQVSALGSEWTIQGAGDYLGLGQDQFLLENTQGVVAVGALAGGQASYAAVSQIGAEWSFEGSGDFYGDGKTQFLVENTSGAVAVGEIGSGGQTTYAAIGGLDSSWSFDGVGDFLADGKEQFLIQNTAGALALGEVSASGQADYTLIGGLGAEWKFAGAGDYAGASQTSFLFENTQGAVIAGTVAGGSAHYTQVAGLGSEWSFRG